MPPALPPTPEVPDLVDELPPQRPARVYVPPSVGDEYDADVALVSSSDGDASRWMQAPSSSTRAGGVGRVGQALDAISIELAGRYEQPEWDDDFLSTCPIVLSFDGQAVRFDAASAATEHFDFGGGQACRGADWPAPSTPWLARDLNGNGRIDGGHELFGTGTQVAGGFADDGFVALGTLDDNGDGWVTAADRAWPSLLLWADFDRDRRTAPGELGSLADAGVTKLSVEHTEQRECDERGNCMIERAPVVWTTGDGAIRVGAAIDVHLVCR